MIRWGFSPMSENMRYYCGVSRAKRFLTFGEGYGELSSPGGRDITNVTEQSVLTAGRKRGLRW
jgi:hypothetical protein